MLFNAVVSTAPFFNALGSIKMKNRGKNNCEDIARDLLTFLFVVCECTQYRTEDSEVIVAVQSLQFE
jgi:hypothetical protein